MDFHGTVVSPRESVNGANIDRDPSTRYTIEQQTTKKEEREEEFRASLQTSNWGDAKGEKKGKNCAKKGKEKGKGVAGKKERFVKERRKRKRGEL